MPIRDFLINVIVWFRPHAGALYICHHIELSIIRWMQVDSTRFDIAIHSSSRIYHFNDTKRGADRWMFLITEVRALRVDVVYNGVSVVGVDMMIVIACH